MKISPHYLGERGAAYLTARLGDPHHQGYALNAEHFLPYLSSADRLLDFGCGNGGMLRVLQQHVGAATGVEVNPAARNLAAESGLEVFGSLDELPEEQAFDVVVSNHVLEHVRDVPSTLERLRTKLVSGGRLLLKLPLDDWRASEQQRWQTPDVDHHLQTWTPLLLANVLREAGFVVRDCRVLTSAWHPRLFPLVKLGLAKPAFWILARWLKRRQLFAVAVAP